MSTLYKSGKELSDIQIKRSHPYCQNNAFLNNLLVSYEVKYVEQLRDVRA